MAIVMIIIIIIIIIIIAIMIIIIALGYRNKSTEGGISSDSGRLDRNDRGHRGSRDDGDGKSKKRQAMVRSKGLLILISH